MPSQLTKKFPRNFLPKDFNPVNETEIAEFYRKLLSFSIFSGENLIKFLDYWSELGSIIDEAGSLAYVNMTC
ncbi:MAG: hypothetical protein KDK36_13290, partial [Leptospiraceae bacterium]|nr:hypothetical protein [Leptospiraceae bacterium]